MINPCNPCVCLGTPCEQCEFGYTSAEYKHNKMVNIIQRVEAGKGSLFEESLVEKYKCRNRDWIKQMGLEEKGETDMNNRKEAGIYLDTECEKCIHNKVCGKKDNAKNECVRLGEMTYCEGPNGDYDYNTMMKTSGVVVTFSCPDFCKIEPVKRNGGF